MQRTRQQSTTTQAVTQLSGDGVGNDMCNAPVETLTAATISSEQLLPDGTLTIRHNNEDYCLRITRNGKLILTK